MEFSTNNRCYFSGGLHAEIPRDSVNNLEGMFCLRGKMLVHLKEYTRAISAFREVITLNPDSWEGNANLGIAYLNSDFFEKAIKHFSISIALKEVPDLLYYRGIAYLNSKEYSLACKDLEKTLSIDEGHESAACALIHTRRMLDL